MNIAVASTVEGKGVKHCLHCNADMSGEGLFCCNGCEAAYAVDSQVNDNVLQVAHCARQTSDGQWHIILAVEGIHCASCIRLIENTLLEEANITQARVNMSTNRLQISWQGDQEEANKFAANVAKLGYRVKPYSAKKNLSYEVEEAKMLLRAIAIAGFAAGNLMLLSVALWTTSQEVMGVATRDLLHWVSALIAIPAIGYAGRPFFLSAWSVLKQRHTNMDVPISIGVMLATSMSVFETFRHGEHVYFDSAVMLLFFLLIGRYLDARARGKARESARDLLSMMEGSATVLTEAGQKTLAIKDLQESMRVAVAMGENIPVDSVVLQGESEIDMSLISGETIPYAVKAGSKVFAGTTNLSAPLIVEVSKASEDSLLSDIVKLLEKAEQGQARYVRMADKAASLYTPVVHVMGLLTFLGWWLWMDAPWQTSLLHAITVLIITCPCALGLAVPVVQVIASNILMRKGVLLKSGDALERLADIDTIVFDKTGTLTVGKPELSSGTYTEELFQLAASLASHSKHPLSKALFAAWQGSFVQIENIKEFAGKGLEGSYNGKIVRLGSYAWCDVEHDNTQAHLALWLRYGDKVAQFNFADELREDAKQVIAQCKQAGLDLMLLSGDRKPVVASMAKELVIDKYYAELTPIEKCDYLDEQKQQGAKILMVGDGLNDAPALASAQVSMSPSSAIDITQNTADIVFQGKLLQPIIVCLKIAKSSINLVKQNFMLAVLYNMVAIPIAVMGYVTPLVAAVAMSGSSLIVIANAFRLYKVKKEVE